MTRRSITFIGILLVSVVLAVSYTESAEAIDCSFFSEEVDKSGPSGSVINKRYVKKAAGHVILGPCYDKSNCARLCDDVLGGFQSDCIERSPGDSVCACCHHKYDHTDQKKYDHTEL